MCVWIRSQEKETIANIVSMYMSNDNNICGYDESSNNADSYYRLGNYSSKEKAIKVLDMIQEHIECVYDIEMFQMPLDEEVEV